MGRNGKLPGDKRGLANAREDGLIHSGPGTPGEMGWLAPTDGDGADIVSKPGHVDLVAEARLLTRPAAQRYLGGEPPERFGVEPIKGKRHRLYDRRAIDAALDRMAGLEPADLRVSSSENTYQALVDEWR